MHYALCTVQVMPDSQADYAVQVMHYALCTMHYALCTVQVMPDSLADYAVRSDTLRKFTKDAAANKQKMLVRGTGAAWHACSPGAPPMRACMPRSSCCLLLCCFLLCVVAMWPCTAVAAVHRGEAGGRALLARVSMQAEVRYVACAKSACAPCWGCASALGCLATIRRCTCDRHVCIALEDSGATVFELPPPRRALGTHVCPVLHAGGPPALCSCRECPCC